jgi:phenylacetate-CoA ligase
MTDCQTFGRKLPVDLREDRNQATHEAPAVDRDARVRATVEACYAGSAFYRSRLERLGVEPGDIRGVDDLERLPVLLGKEDERELQEQSRATAGHPFGDHLCVDPAEVVAVASTSGTTGTPTFYAFTREDVAVTDELCGRPESGPAA